LRRGSERLPFEEMSNSMPRGGASITGLEIAIIRAIPLMVARRIVLGSLLLGCVLVRFLLKHNRAKNPRQTVFFKGLSLAKALVSVSAAG